ncbi:MAG: hypothetical protein IT495_14285 [Gammaproteobacteria bacterium]|nr:hypothetical protein [Gammaproteobacteria bacterium]
MSRRAGNRGTMDTYDPLHKPDAAQWQALDESTRVNIVVAWHRRAGEHLANETMHAAVHVMVENQLALAELPVAHTLSRLMHEGLDRHEAIHAVGSVLVAHLHELIHHETADPPANRAYFERLEKLTARRWRRGRF